MSKKLRIDYAVVAGMFDDGRKEWIPPHLPLTYYTTSEEWDGRSDFDQRRILEKIVHQEHPEVGYIKRVSSMRRVELREKDEHGYYVD